MVEGAEPRFLYMCLGDPGDTVIQSGGAAGIDIEGPSHVDVYGGHFLLEGDDSSDCSPDGDQWEWENLHDPISPDQLPEFASASPDIVVSVY